MKVCARLFSAISFSLLLAVSVLAQGTVVTEIVYSPSLDREHPVNIYLPQGYNPDDQLTRYPVIYYMHSGWGNHQSEPEAITALNQIIGSEIRPVILVKPSTYHGPYHGMTWYTNSILNGNYEDFIAEDLIAHIDSSYNTMANRSKRCIEGFSMGGYGAIKLAIKHPDLFTSVATHGGIVYIEQYLELLTPLVIEESGGSGPFVPSSGTWGDLLYSNAAAFSPNLDNDPYFVDLPIDNNGDVIGSVWMSWELQDPYSLLTNMSSDYDLDFHLDAGTGDYWYPLTTSMADRLDEFNIEYTRKSFGGVHEVPVSRFIEAFTFHDSVMWAETPHPERTLVSPTAVEPLDMYDIQTEVANADGINYDVSAILRSEEGTYQEIVDLYDDGTHNDGEAGDNIWGGTVMAPEMIDFFDVSIVIANNDLQEEIVFGNEANFTTLTDVFIDNIAILPEGSVPLPGETHFFRFSVFNSGETGILEDVSIGVVYEGDEATFITRDVIVGDINPGESRLSMVPLNVSFAEDCQENSIVNIDLMIKTGGIEYWPDTLRVEIGPDLSVENELNLPTKFELQSIYPNPFNAQANVKFAVPFTSEIEISIFNILGKKVDVLFKGQISQGSHTFTWDAQNFTSGIYLLSMKSDTGWNTKRKLILIK